MFNLPASFTTGKHLRHLACVLLLLSIHALQTLAAESLLWTFDIPHKGRVLYEGGWFQKYSLGSIAATSEFTFPLELVYLSTRETSGMFGPQWFCPQLESTVIPQGVGGFIWQTPAGNIVIFRRAKDAPSFYTDVSGEWRAKATADHQEIQNRDGWVYSYDHGHLKSLLSPTNRSLNFIWNGHDFQGLELVDTASGSKWPLLEVKESDSGHTISELSFNGIVHHFTYQNIVGGGLDTWTLPNNDRIGFGYSQQGVLNQIQHPPDPVQNFVCWIRDTNLSSSDQKDPANWWLVQDPDNKYTYGSSDRKGAVLLSNKVTITTKAGETVTVDYNPRGGALVESQGPEKTRTSTYYRAPGQIYDGKIKSLSYNGLIKAQYTYDPKTGLLSSITDENGITTHFDYPPDWKRTPQNPWDPKPIRVWRGDPDNPEVIASYEYDAAGRVLSAQDAAGQTTRVGYSPRGEIVDVASGDGAKASVNYDAFGRVLQVKKDNQSDSVEYDDMGHLKSHTAADGSKTEYTYDSLGNVAQISRNGKVITTYIRDARGTLVGQRDALGRLRRIDSDSRGNILADYAADGTVTRYEYDDLGRRTAQIDGNGNKVTFTYDAGGHLIKQVNALGDTLTWTYDDAGHLIEHGNGVQKTKYTYDENDRLVTVDYGSPDQKITNTYDDRGRVISSETPAASFYYIYDKYGRLDSTRAVRGKDEELIRYFYNFSGQRTGLIVARYIPAIDPANGKIGRDAHYEILQQTEYKYENRLLKEIDSNGKPVLTYKYDAVGRPVVKTYGNGIRSELSYDTFGHLAQASFAGGPITVPLFLTYTWDQADQVVSRSWNGRTFNYDYDAAGKLARVTDVTDPKKPQVLESYTYDKAGNITEKILQGEKTTFTYNAGNELLNASAGPNSSITYTYDPAGRLLSYTGGPQNTYGWLDKVTVAKSGQGSGPAIAFRYWPDGQLAAKGLVTGKDGAPEGPDAESFLWDNLALLQRNSIFYISEPHLSGGAAIASHDVTQPQNNIYYINDLLGTTLAVIKNDMIQFNDLTSFGQARRPLAQNITPPMPLQTPLPATTTISPPQQQLPPTAN